MVITELKLALLLVRLLVQKDAQDVVQRLQFQKSPILEEVDPVVIQAKQLKLLLLVHRQVQKL
jgi:hypothetical protein